MGGGLLLSFKLDTLFSICFQKYSQDLTLGHNVSSEWALRGAAHPIVVPRDMATKMKGLLKGLRYISQIFDTDSKEQEMQIGYPTDVKHVAHIGWDGPSVNAPSWMNDFRSSSAPLSANEAGAPPKFPSSEFGGAQYSAARGLQELPAPRPSRRNASSGGSSVDSPHREPRQSGRHQVSSAATAVDSPVRESLEACRHNRRHRSSVGVRQEITAGSVGGSDSQEREATVPKRDRPRRKTKGSSSGGGSVRSASRSKAVASESEGVVESQSSYSVPSLKTTIEEEGF